MPTKSTARWRGTCGSLLLILPVFVLVPLIGCAKTSLFGPMTGGAADAERKTGTSIVTVTETRIGGGVEVSKETETCLDCEIETAASQHVGKDFAAMWNGTVGRLFDAVAGYFSGAPSQPLQLQLQVEGATIRPLPEKPAHAAAESEISAGSSPPLGPADPKP